MFSVKLNKLAVNVSKIKCMIFHKRKDTPQLDLLLNNIKIELVSNFTFLGIILDTSLSWKFHTKNDCYQNIKNIWYFTQVKIYFFERSSINNIQNTNYGSLELWPLIIGSKS